MKLKILFLIACSALFIAGTKSEILHEWDVYTISINSGKIYSNPYKDIPVTKGGDLLKVSFMGTGGNALNKEITVVGFWNGGSEWRVNFF